MRADRVVTVDGLVPAVVAVTNGKISAILRPDAAMNGDAAAARGASGGEYGAAGAGTVVQLAADEVLLPGLVDTHVHVNEPGRTQWEGFATATAAAAAGGVTTIADMPLNCVPPTTAVTALRLKQTAAAGQCRIDVAFWGGAVPGNEPDRPALHEAGVLGFKCFTVDSGVPEFPPLGDAGLERAAAQLAALGGLLLVHAEDPRWITQAARPGSQAYADFLSSRPDQAETAAVARALEIARHTGVRLHILHVSSAEVLPLLAAARAEGLAVTAETCPHYLALAAEDIPDGATQFKCCPPIRVRANRDQLWEGLRAGIIDSVVSDHSPCPPALKRLAEGDFAAAWGGIASVQLALSVVWTFGRERGVSLVDVARWMSASPASIAGLPDKGGIEVGRDADLVAFAPAERFTVDPAILAHRHKLTPYAGARLAGAVRRTWLRGREVYPAAADTRPAGRLLVRPRLAAGAQ